MEKLKISVKLNCEPKTVFTCLLNASQHSQLTGSKCQIEPSEKSAFSLLNGAVTGKVVEMFPYKRLLITWRHEWYEPQDPESKVELLFIYKEDHTLLTITQSQIPDEMSEKIKELWKKKYFKSLKNRFNTV